MTREEAIAILQSMIPTPCRADGKSTTHTLVTIALDMAIKALGQTEPEKCGDCISRTELLKKQQIIIDEHGLEHKIVHIGKIIDAPSVEPEKCEDVGEISDGYHTFNQLYHQRAILFAAIVNQNKDISWKSYKHSDGKYCFDSDGEWFVVGIDTPKGSYTYHYSKEYWDYFECKELDCGKEWDGHTEEDVTRLLSLKQPPCGDCVSRQAVLDLAKSGKLVSNGNYKSVCDAINGLQSVEPERKPGKWIWDKRTGTYHCSECGHDPLHEDVGEIAEYKYCMNCGAEMEVDG